MILLSTGELIRSGVSDKTSMYNRLVMFVVSCREIVNCVSYIEVTFVCHRGILSRIFEKNHIVKL